MSLSACDMVCFMKSDIDQSCLYQFVRKKISEELHIGKHPTYLEEELLCSLTVLVYHFCDLSADTLDRHIHKCHRTADANHTENTDGKCTA